MQQAALFDSAEQDVFSTIAEACDWVRTSDIRRATSISRDQIHAALDTLVDGGMVEEGRLYYGSEKPGKDYQGFGNIYRIKRKEAS